MSDDDEETPRWKSRLWKAVIGLSVIAALATAYFMYDGWREHKRVQRAVGEIAVVFDDLERCTGDARALTAAKVNACADAADHAMARYASLRERHDELKEFWSAIDDLRHPVEGQLAIAVCTGLDRGRAEVAKLRGEPHSPAECKAPAAP